MAGFQVDGPVSGWIFGEIDNEAMFERFPPHWQSTSAVYSLASAPNGFLSFGWRANGSDDVMLASSDGMHWHTSEAPPLPGGERPRTGRPAGSWPATVDGPSATTTMLWQSADAESWERLGALPPEMTGSFMSLAGSQAGYVLLANTGGGASAVWFSADGLLWTERPVGRTAAADMGTRLAATPLGFFIWGLNDPDHPG